QGLPCFRSGTGQTGTQASAQGASASPTNMSHRNGNKGRHPSTQDIQEVTIMATKKTRGLGRGLDSLLGTDSTIIQSLGENSGPQAGEPAEMALSAIKPGVYQPRTAMDEQALEELADSIRSQGVMQPILVRPLAKSRSRIQKY